MLKITLIALILYAVACLFLYIKQRDLIFFPTPERFDLDAEALWMQTGGARLKVWRINQGPDAILYFGGNSEQIEDNINDFKRMFGDQTVYLANYRGYGGSSGRPDEQGLFDDALSLYDQLKKEHSSISVIGRSLGSGVACYLAAHRDVDKLILTTPYDSIQNVAQSHYPLFPVRWLLKDRFDSLSYVSDIHSPILVLLAEHDRIVPLANSKRLLSAINDSKRQSQMIPGSLHNDISSNPAYQKALTSFIGKPL